MAVKLDATTSVLRVHRWLAQAKHAYYTSQQQKAPYKTETKYYIQWKVIKKDFQKSFIKPDLLFRYAYGLLVVYLFFKKGIILPFFAGPVAFDAGTSGIAADTTTDPATYSHTTSGTDRVLFVTSAVNADTTRTTDGVTYNSVAMTLAGTKLTQGTRESSCWKLVGPASGANTVSVDWSGTPNNANLVLMCSFAVSFTGANDINNEVTQSVSAGTSASVNVTSAVDNMAVDFMLGAADAVTAGAGQTERANSTNNLRKISTEAGAATVTMSWSWTTSGDGTLQAYNVVAGSQAVGGSPSMTMLGVGG